MVSTGVRGRHRLAGAASTAPGARGDRDTDRCADSEADTLVLPLPVVLLPEPTPRSERPATGLAKFDLGTIPASVTPPRSWRRAAWFSVGSAVLVVAGLAFAAVALMSAPRDPGRVDALPGLPSGEPLLPPDAPIASPTGGPSTSRATPTASRTPAPAEPGASPSASVPLTVPADGAPTTTSAPPAASTRPSGSVEPSRTTVSNPVLLAPVNDPAAMGDRTQEYFQRVVDDPQAAYALTTGSLRGAGPDSIEQRYAAVERIDVTGIEIDPARSRTRASLRVVGRDGSVTQLDRELTFTYGADPKISAERAVT